MSYVSLLIVFGFVMGISIINNFQRRYIQQPFLISTYFFIASFVVLFAFPSVRTLPWLNILLGLVVVYGIALLSYFLTRRFIARPTYFIERNGDKNVFTKLAYPFLLTKGFEILFQQLCFTIFILLLSSQGLSIISITLLSAALLAATHVPLVLTHGTHWGTGYAIGATMLGFALPYLILGLPHGFVISFALHLLGYVFAGVVIWLVHSKKDIIFT